MRKSIIIYSILLVCLIGISLFLTSNFLDSSKANPNEVIVKNIFQADEVSLRISFNDTEIDFVIKSEMLNSLADSDFMRLFSPEIYFDNNKDLSIFGKSQNADFFYKANIIEFKDDILEGLKILVKQQEFYRRHLTRLITLLDDVKRQAFVMEKIKLIIF